MLAEVELADDVIERRWADVMASILTKRPYELAPWQPLPGEPRLAQLAFYSYRDSAQRNLGLVASTMAMKFEDIRDFAHLYNWTQRAEMYDEWVERQGDDARADLIAKTTQDTAAAFSRLPSLASSAFQLVEGAVNAKLARQAELAQRGKSLDADAYDEDDDDEIKPISLTQATRIAETVRGLLDATTRFLGVKVTHEHTHRGTLGHVHAVTDQDAIKFLEGLTEAGYDVGSIEAASHET